MSSFHHSFEPFTEDHRAETAFIHETSQVDTPCHIGEHTSILNFSYVMAHSIIGNHCQIGRNVTIASGVFLGDNVRVLHNAQLNSGVILENDVYCGVNTVFVDPRQVRASTGNVSRISPTLVRRGAQIGPNATVASGFTIGQFAFIEAGTVVDRNIPDFAVAYGNPLKLAGWRCECGQLMPKQRLGAHRASAIEEEMLCVYCNRRYLRQSQWKVLQLTREDTTRDSHSEFDPTVRAAQNTD